jgi:hypothetical protein
VPENGAKRKAPAAGPGLAVLVLRAALLLAGLALLAGDGIRFATLFAFEHERHLMTYNM